MREVFYRAGNEAQIPHLSSSYLISILNELPRVWLYSNDKSDVKSTIKSHLENLFSRQISKEWHTSLLGALR
jgi:hypothetical protein